MREQEDFRWRARVFLGGGRPSVDLVAHLHEVRVVHHHFDHVLQDGVADEDRVHFAVQILRLQQTSVRKIISNHVDEAK
jgi:hypothetical protein